MSRTVVPVRVRVVGLVAAASLAVGGLVPAVSVVAADVTPEVVRISGADRYEVSARVAQETFEPGVPVVYVATGTTFPDALSGAAAAGTQGGPVLLVRPSSIPGAIATELDRLNPGRIVVLGGPVSVSAAVETQLATYTEGDVTRIAGANRYDVSAAVSAATFPTGVATAYVATGASFPDALSSAAPAGSSGSPVLLVPGTTIPASVSAELSRLAPSEIIILGGTASVSPAVAAQLESYTDGTVTRIAGANRYEVSASLSASSYAPGVPVAYVATGKNFADALSGAPAAAAQDGPVLLVDGGSIPAAVTAELQRLEPARIVILGGTASVGAAVVTALGTYLVAPPAPTEVCGDVTEDTVWRGQVTVTCPLNVTEGATLRLGNGVRVLFEPGARLWVYGSVETAQHARGVSLIGADPVEGEDGSTIFGFDGAHIELVGAAVNGLILRFDGQCGVTLIGNKFDSSKISLSECSPTIERNSFSGEIEPVVVWSATDPTGLVLIGPEQNTFSEESRVRVGSTSIADDTTWTVSSDGGASLHFDLATHGELVLAPGTTLLNSVVSVLPGGTLTALGVAADPVNFEGSPPGLDRSSIEIYSGATIDLGHTRFTLMDKPAVTARAFSSDWAPTQVKITDSHFGSPVTFELLNGRPVLERNTFEMDPPSASGPVQWTPLTLNASDVSGVNFRGANANTFVATNVPNLVDFGGGTLPSGVNWEISRASNATFVGKFHVDGRLTAHPGTIFKSPELIVGGEGSLDIFGTSSRPVIFTDLLDNSAGGDSATQTAFEPDYSAPYIRFEISDPDGVDSSESSMSYVQIRRADIAISVGEWVSLYVGNSQFDENRVAFQVDAAATSPQPPESPWAVLPCAPPFNSIVVVETSWFGDNGLAGVDGDVDELMDAFGVGPIPAGMPDDALTTAAIQRLQQSWNVMSPVPGYLTGMPDSPHPSERFNLVPVSQYSCDVAGETISFPWLPVWIDQPASQPLFGLQPPQ